MTNDRGDSTNHLTFSQRYGYEPLPEPMRLEEISVDLRRDLWNTIRNLLLGMRSYGGGYYFADQEARCIERVIGKYSKIPESSVSTDYSKVMAHFEKACTSLAFNRLLEMLEAIINDNHVRGFLNEKIRHLFEIHEAAYRLDTSRSLHQFTPISSEAQGEATRQAMETIEQSGIAVGASSHLRKAIEHLNAGRYADSISDSIHAVESVACVIDPKANKTLGPALDSLESAGLLHHAALKGAFAKLYGYTSDEQGIRHALLERDAASVDLDEAMFMFGACASFAAYLVNRYQKADGARPKAPN